MAGAQRQKNGVLTAAVELIHIGDLVLPFTIVLRSAAPGRALGLSFDNGIEAFPIATIDQTSATEMVLHVTVPCTHVRFTGTTGDAWMVIWNRTDV